MHYAVVLDKENKHSANAITVVPLSSYKDKCYERDVFLGDDLFKQVNSKWKTLSKTTSESYEKTETLSQLIEEQIKVIEEAAATSDTPTKSDVANFQKLILEFTKQKEELTAKKKQLENMETEIALMKKGSIAKIEQITTVSKMRIWDPKRTADVLYGVRLSPESMNAINEKIKQLFIF